MFEPMLAAPIDEVPTDDSYLLEAKLDGWRALAGIQTDGASLSTRTGNPITSVRYITAALATLPPDTVLDGEIVDLTADPERSWSRTQTICSRTQPHRPTAEDPPLTLVVFDALMVRGAVLTHRPLLARKHALRGLFPAGSIEAPGLGVVVREAEWQQSKPAVARELVKRGHEGVMVKHRDSRYLSGARNGGWYKWKPGGEIEATCTGFTAGQGRHDELVGAIRFRLQNGYEGTASGMSDAERREMTEHPERYVGNVIELSYQTITTDGALRHPQYRRLRDPAEKPTPNLPATGHAVVRHGNATAGARTTPGRPAARAATPPAQLTTGRWATPSCCAALSSCKPVQDTTRMTGACPAAQATSPRTSPSASTSSASEGFDGPGARTDAQQQQPSRQDARRGPGAERHRPAGPRRARRSRPARSASPAPDRAASARKPSPHRRRAAGARAARARGPGRRLRRLADHRLGPTSGPDARRCRMSGQLALELRSETEKNPATAWRTAASRRSRS